LKLSKLLPRNPRTATRRREITNMLEAINLTKTYRSGDADYGNSRLDRERRRLRVFEFENLAKQAF
jgi:hypothetical protein